MATELLGGIVSFQVSTDLTGATLKKTVVCEETSSLSISTSTTETKTKCGNFTAVSTPTVSVSLSGVVNGAPGGTEVSFNDMAGYANNKTKLYGLVQNAVSGSVALGTAVYCSGTGYFSDVKMDAAEGDLIKYSATFTYSGAVDTTV